MASGVMYAVYKSRFAYIALHRPSNDDHRTLGLDITDLVVTAPMPGRRVRFRWLNIMTIFLTLASSCALLNERIFMFPMPRKLEAL